MTIEQTPRRGARRLAATILAAAVVAALAIVFIYRGTRPRPTGGGAQAASGDETLRVGALPVT